MSLTFKKLADISDSEWDKLISIFPQRTIYHTSDWHTVIKNTFSIDVIRIQIVADDRICGYWCGFEMRKLGFKAFGAPLPGTGTDYMYPLLNNEIIINEFLSGFNQWAKVQGYHILEIAADFMDRDILKENGYEINDFGTYRINLDLSEEEIWKNLKPAMRNKIRKAEKANIVVKEDNSDEFAGLYYDMLLNVFARKNLMPSYKIEFVENIIKILKPVKKVIALTAWHKKDAVATILLLKDHHTFYYWGGASYNEAFKYGANDIIHWVAFKLAVQKNIKLYDTCGEGDYKKKFGGSFAPIIGGYKARNKTLLLTRKIALFSFRKIQSIKGSVRNLAGKLK